MNILDLPIEILTLIVTEDLETFLAAILAPGLGPMLCCEYTQRYAKKKFTSVTTHYGMIVYRRAEKLHREDGPAVTWPSGAIEYYINGKHHREDGPAVIFPTGRVSYYKHGKLHREDGPAIIYPSGKSKYYLNGVFTMIKNTKTNILNE
jgi:hypothetical protein